MSVSDVRNQPASNNPDVESEERQGPDMAKSRPQNATECISPTGHFQASIKSHGETNDDNISDKGER